MTIVVRIPLVLLSVCVLTACGAGDDRAGATVVRDSVGIVVAENPARSSTPLPWRLSASPVLEIGRTEGKGPDVFGSIRQVIRLRTGEIAVADALAREVRVFDATGAHVRTIGRAGGGPGEFMGLWSIAELVGDSIVAVDNLNGQVSVFDGEGEYARSFRIPRPDGAGAPNVVGVLDDGDVVVQAQTNSQSGSAAGGADPGTMALQVFTVGDGAVTADIGEFDGLELGRNGLGLGFGADAVLAAADSLIWYAHTSRFELLALDRNGSVRQIVRMKRAPRQVTAAEIAEARAKVEESLARQGASADATRRIMETEFADAHPVHGRVLIDALGHLWVAGYTSHLLDSDSPNERQERWDVFEPDGRYLGTITMPDGFEVGQIDKGFIAGVHTDALGVQRVRVYGLERG